MAGTFHWIKMRLFCYSTEDEGKLEDVMNGIAGGGFEKEITEGHHGNRIAIMQSEITKDRDARTFFSVLGSDIVSEVLKDLERMVDDDCVLHFRIDKQKAVCGSYEIVHHSDVISVDAKIVSHPARKDVAVSNARSFLDGLQRCIVQQ